jgi:hypothetical protein
MITALEHERLSYINNLMDELNCHNADIYEALCDREHYQAQYTIKELVEKLKSLHDSLEDEI